ncbi:MAG TPA: DUF4878 domain-containing protein [Ferruginibacter sp.]|nr:DUF4878 domain-containing protein [Ferruginibacter sp.]
MKKVILIFCLLAGIAACNSHSDMTSPSGTMNAMFTAMKNGNMDDIKKFITKKDVQFIESAEKLMNSVDPDAIAKMKTKMGDEFKAKVKDMKYTLKNEKVEGDKATVDAEVTENGKTDSHTFNLVKEDGAWKISLLNSGDGMFNSMKGDMGPGSKDLEEGLEKLKNMNPDSLKMLMQKGLDALDSMKTKMEKQ